jgi:hypothetical protein
VQVALAGPMDLDPSLIEIIEFTNTVTDDFSSGIVSDAWLNGGGAVWSVASGALQATVAAGVDLRYEARTTPFLLQAAEPGRLYVSAKISSFGALSQSAFAGLALHNRATNDWLWFGIFNAAGTSQLVWRAAVAGGAPGSGTVLVAHAGAGPYWLRIATSQAAGFVDDGALTLSHSTLGSNAGFTNVAINSGHARGWLWAGLTLFSTVAAPPTTSTATIDDFMLHSGDSLRPYVWYAFRDMTLPGHPDLIGADRLCQKIKPAYTYAAAITSRKVICDDPRDGVCDRGPVG